MGFQIADPVGRAVDTGVKLYNAIEGTRQHAIANQRAERELKMREEAYATQREMAQMELDKKRREFKDEVERRQFDEDFQYFSDAFVVGADNPEEARARLQKFTPDRKERLQQYFPGMSHLFANAPKVGSAAARLRDQVLEIGSAFDEGRPVEGMEVVRRNDGSMLLKGSKVRSLLDTYAEIDEGRFSKIPLKKGTEPEYSMVARPDGTMAVQVTYTKADGSVVQEAPMTRGRTAAGDEGADDDIVSLFTPRQAFDWATGRQMLAQKAMEWQALHGDKEAKKALTDVRSKGLARQEEGRRSQEIGELLKGVDVAWDAKDPHGSAFKYMQALRETGALGEAEILAETTRMLNAKTPKDKRYQIITVGAGNGMEQTVAVNTADPADRVALGKPTAKWKAGDGGGAGGGDKQMLDQVKQETDDLYNTWDAQYALGEHAPAARRLAQAKAAESVGLGRIVAPRNTDRPAVFVTNEMAQALRHRFPKARTWEELVSFAAGDPALQGQINANALTMWHPGHFKQLPQKAEVVAAGRERGKGSVNPYINGLSAQ